MNYLKKVYLKYENGGLGYVIHYFKKEILLNNDRNPFNIKKLEHLPDDDGWLLMSESKPCG